MIKEAIHTLSISNFLKSSTDDALKIIEHASSSTSLRVYRSWMNNKIPAAYPQTPSVLPAIYADYHLLLKYRYPPSSLLNCMQPSDLCILGNLSVSQGSMDAAITLHEYSVANFQERNSLYSLAQVVQHSPSLDSSTEGLKTQAMIGTLSLYHQAALQEHPMAMYNLSLILKNVALETNNLQYVEESDRWMKEASNHGLEASYTPLAQSLLSTSVTDSLVYFQKAIDAGDLKAKLCMGALCAQHGNLNASLTLWHDAVTSPIEEEKWPSNIEAIAECFYRIGNLYFLGKHPDELELVLTESYKDLIAKPVETNNGGFSPLYNVATEFWQLAVEADSQHARASMHLGNMYFDGISVEKNYERAAHHYSEALSSNKVSKDMKPTIEGLLLICYNHLGISPPEDMIQNLPISELKPKRARPLIRIFTPSEDVVDYELGAINGFKQADRQSQTVHDAIARRWKYIEDYSTV